MEMLCVFYYFSPKREVTACTLALSACIESTVRESVFAAWYPFGGSAWGLLLFPAPGKVIPKGGAGGREALNRWLLHTTILCYLTPPNDVV